MNALYAMLYFMGIIYWTYVPIIFLTIWCCFCGCMRKVEDEIVGSMPGMYAQQQTTVVYQQVPNNYPQQIIYD